AELASVASQRGIAVLVGRAFETERTLAFGPWMDALRNARLTENGVFRESLGPARYASLTRLFPGVRADQEPTVHEGDPYAVFESVLEFVQFVASEQPLVIILEDLHWADQLSIRLAAFLGHRLHAAQVMLVATAREDELSDGSELVTVLNELA